MSRSGCGELRPGQVVRRASGWVRNRRGLERKIVALDRPGRSAPAVREYRWHGRPRLTAQQGAIPNLKSTGGAEGDRTPDLVIANDALSHLSYGPVPVRAGWRLMKRPSPESGPLSEETRPLEGQTAQPPQLRPTRGVRHGCTVVGEYAVSAGVAAGPVPGVTTVGRGAYLASQLAASIRYCS
jgi:hypothetical protein